MFRRLVFYAHARWCKRHARWCFTHAGVLRTRAQQWCLRHIRALVFPAHAVVFASHVCAGAFYSRSGVCATLAGVLRTCWLVFASHTLAGVLCTFWLVFASHAVTCLWTPVAWLVVWSFGRSDDWTIGRLGSRSFGKIVRRVCRRGGISRIDLERGTGCSEELNLARPGGEVQDRGMIMIGGGHDF